MRYIELSRAVCQLALTTVDNMTDIAHWSAGRIYIDLYRPVAAAP
jgi:hypothetical protein